MAEQVPGWWKDFAAVMQGETDSEKKKQALKQLGGENLSKGLEWMQQRSQAFEQSVLGGNVYGADEVRTKFDSEVGMVKGVLGDLTELEREKQRIKSKEKGSPGRRQSAPGLSSVLSQTSPGMSLLGT